MTDVTPMPPITTSAFPPAPRALAEPSRFRLSGELDHPASLTVAALRALPQHTVDVEFSCAHSGMRSHTFSGPLLIDVVATAGPRFDPAVTKDRVRFLLAVTGADGHTSVLSWGEIDSHYGHQDVLLAIALDGRALDADGPHLAVPGDRSGGRYVSRVTNIQVAAADRLTWP